MSNVPSDLKYVSSHEWIRLEDDGTVTIGITDHAQEALGDVVYVELPDVDSEVALEDEVAVGESVKAASDIYAPIDGEVIEINNSLSDDASIVNQDPENTGWIFKMKISNSDQYSSLMTLDEYLAFLEN